MSGQKLCYLYGMLHDIITELVTTHLPSNKGLRARQSTGSALFHLLFCNSEVSDLATAGSISLPIRRSWTRPDHRLQ